MQTSQIRPKLPRLKVHDTYMNDLLGNHSHQRLSQENWLCFMYYSQKIEKLSGKNMKLFREKNVRNI